jgi:hypothetical protein
MPSGLTSIFGLGCGGWPGLLIEAQQKSVARLVFSGFLGIAGERGEHGGDLPEKEHGDDSADYAAMARRASRTGCGVARVEWLPGNVGCLDFQPVLFPVGICGDAMAAAMSLVAPAEALIIDVRNCPGGEPGMATWLSTCFTGPATFSGGEQLAYDLRQTGRATIIGQRTRGGAHARQALAALAPEPPWLPSRPERNSIEPAARRPATGQGT